MAPSRAAAATHGSLRPGVSEATAARARGGQYGKVRPGSGAVAGAGASWPCETIVRSPSYAMETVTGECQPGTVCDIDRSMPSPCSRASQQYSP